MKKLLSSLFILLLFAANVIAQERTVTGTVKGKDDGLPLPGVSVRVKGSTIGTQTGSNGQFSIKVPGNNATLVFTYIGYSEQQVVVGAKTVINALLVSDTKQLGEVVVTALGISRQAKSLGYSASVVKSDELTKARETNVLNSLAGKAAGVRINSQSGTLGGSTKVVIRGVNSLGASEVLFIIDGVPVSNGTSSGGTTSNNVDYGNRIGDLSSDDIESMTVLKGAAAAALYGSRARDGAIVITTKKGSKGQSVSIDVNSSMRFDNPLVLPDFQNEYAQGTFNPTTKQYDYSLKNLNGWGPKIADVQNQTFPNFLGNQVTLQAHPDNVKDFFDTGVSYLNNVAFSGGDQNSDYRLSFSAANEKGIIPNSKLGKYNFSINAGRQFSKTLSSRFSGSYSRISADGRPAQSSNNLNIITSAVYGLPRTIDINDIKNNYEDPVTKNQIFLSSNRDGNNPYWIVNYNTNNNKVDRFVGSYTLNYKPTTWLTVNNNLGGDIYRERRTSVVRKGTAGTLNGKFSNYDLFYRQINNDFIVTAEKNDLVKDLDLKFILGNNINERESQSTNVDALDLTIDQLWNYTNAASKNPTLGYSKRRVIGVYGDLSLSYKDYLYLDVTGRNDWTSTLPVQSRSYFYPSVGGSFIFSELLKDKNLDWLSYGKLRASWASVGSDLDPYNLDFQYNPVSTVFMQYVSSTAVAFPTGSILTAFTGPRILPNANLKPQRQNSYEFGAEMRFLNNRIGFDLTYYNTKTRDQLIPIDVAISTGYFAKYVNVGLISNKGIELAANFEPVKNKDFTWGINVNFAKNKQKVEELAPGLTQYSLASGWSGLQIKAKPGESFQLYGSKWERDSVSGQLILNSSSGLRTAVADKPLGTIYPDWTMGISNELRYKGVSLSALVDIRQGGVFYSGTVAALRASGLAKETAGDRTPIVDPGLMRQGDKGTLVPNTTPVRSMQDYWNTNYATSLTEANVFDASFIKLREVRLSYMLPKSLFRQGSVIKTAEIGIEARNLWLIKSHVPHVDPELNFFGAGSVGEGVEFNSVPSTRSFGANLRLSF
ncbi:SusC/RagA family TonB-linked outer membrane protein [Arcticibacter sp. MXS-1]|uniref:SusC/RagA family TonB-linked outer membrane protein n=1 Tax=Arcticibacter sp. MXS-1 TaxID=3341726 RepID=UPI0035A8A429